MADNSQEKAKLNRLRWQGDEETADSTKIQELTLRRTASTNSQFSIRSARSLARRATVDPALTLPIHYRTV